MISRRLLKNSSIVLYDNMISDLTTASLEQTQSHPEISSKKSSIASKILPIITMLVFAYLAILGAMISSLVTGIFPLFSICAFAMPLLLASLFLLRNASQQKPQKTGVVPPRDAPLVIEINENTKHTKILEQCGEVVTTWNTLPHIFGETTPSLLNKVWKINNSKTVLFATTGTVYSPRVHYCCNLMIVLERNTLLSDLCTINTSYEIPMEMQAGQCVSMPWKNSDGSSNKQKLGLPNFLGIIHGPNPELYNYHPVIAFALAKAAYTNCLNEAIKQGVDMIQIPLIATATAQLYSNPQAAADWRAAIQTGLVAALINFAASQPETIMNVVIVSSPGLGLPL
ncbi:inner membrane protein [Chlamydia abortus]|nr:macro domain-containing protein [Chlamydia abortus]CED80469.1 putative inner membrane protein [Chlamydia abortus]CED81429.1 putative inner membrane protein [Chlamydia abortus]CEF16875.1 putative inner membrane protein [Chlamydia abortus]SHE10244.1 inner membrane protein [Chlamydia abortus]